MSHEPDVAVRPDRGGRVSDASGAAGRAMTNGRRISTPFAGHHIHCRRFPQSPAKRSDGEAFAAAAGALGVGIFEHEPGGEIVLAPVHDAADQVQHRRAVDVEGAAGSLDLLVERILLGDIIDRISEARTAAARGRQLDPDRTFGRAAISSAMRASAAGRQRDRGAGARGLSFRLFIAFPIRAALRRSFSTGPTAGPRPVSPRRRGRRAPTARAARPRSASDSATGQCGVVSVMVTTASPSSLMATS